MTTTTKALAFNTAITITTLSGASGTFPTRTWDITAYTLTNDIETPAKSDIAVNDIIIDANQNRFTVTVIGSGPIFILTVQETPYTDQLTAPAAPSQANEGLLFRPDGDGDIYAVGSTSYGISDTLFGYLNNRGNAQASEVIDDSITTDKIAAGAVTFAKIVDASTGSVLIGRGTSGSGPYSEMTIDSTLSITGTSTPVLSVGVIQTSNIADGAVTNAKLSGNSVQNSNIKNLNVTANKLGSMAVETDKIDALAVTAAKLATDSVETDKINALAVTAAKLATNSVETDKINALAVTAAKLATNSVINAKILNLNVTSNKLADNAVVASKINASAVTAAKLATNAVETDKILNDAVTFAKIENGGAGTIYWTQK